MVLWHQEPAQAAQYIADLDKSIKLMDYFSKSIKCESNIAPKNPKMMCQDYPGATTKDKRVLRWFTTKIHGEKITTALVKNSQVATALGVHLGSMHKASRALAKSEPGLVAKYEMWHPVDTQGKPVVLDLPPFDEHFGICHGNFTFENVKVSSVQGGLYQAGSRNIYGAKKTWFLYDLGSLLSCLDRQGMDITAEEKAEFR